MRDFSLLRAKTRAGYLVLAIVAILLIGALAWSGAAPAQGEDSTDWAALITEETPSAVEAQYEFLKEQVTEFRDFVERERIHHEHFVEWTLGIGLAIFTLVFSVLGWIGIRSLTDAKKNIKDLVIKQFEEYINQESDEVWGTINDIAANVVGEKLNLNKSVCVVAPNPSDEKEARFLVQILESRGLKSIDLKIGDAIELDGYELFVYKYDANLEQHLIGLVRQLKNNPKPLIVYSTERVVSTEFSSYEWRLLANTPLSLVNWVFFSLATFDKLRSSK